MEIQTSGSTGEPRLVRISQAALNWSAAATHAYLGGPGRWVEALPPDRVGGAQVLNRARLAGEAGVPHPLIICGDPAAVSDMPTVHFSVPELIAALELAFSLPEAPVYLSLVPTELYAVFHAPAEQREQALNLLARCRAILVGGAALDSMLRKDAETHGLNIVQTYGMTETSGGCVYDGTPLPGAMVRLAAPDDAGAGIIELSGPMLADGYTLPGVTGFYSEGETRWFRTSDLGRWDDAGTLQVLGRADDVIITGGVNVHPHLVEDALESAWFELTEHEALIVAIGQPHAKWGQQIVAVVEHPEQLPPHLAAQLLALSREKLGPVAAPKQIRTLPTLPTLPGGKVDRKLIAQLIEITGQIELAGVSGMATRAEWISAARPRTLPASIAPVLVGLGAAFGARHYWDENHPFSAAEIQAAGFWHNFSWVRALLALGVALALQIGVNYANDYSDGIRGTDLDRTGPTRLTASGKAEPKQVKTAAFVAFGIAALLGLGLAWLSGAWGLLVVGALAIIAAWFYTGGKHPYGYAGLGEVFVFIFFGLVATLGTTFSQIGRITLTSILGAIGTGLLASAILMINNIRDIETDRLAGKHTLAARLGSTKARRWFMNFIYLAFACAFLAAIWLTPWAWLTALLLVPALLITAPVRIGVKGKLLIPVLSGIANLELAYALILAIAFAL